VLPGALGRPDDRVLFLIGHDTNIENIAGALNLTWIIDGRRDDTPPGGAIIFELWRNTASGAYSVRTYFTAQSLDQMRMSSELTLQDPPDRVAVFLPGCSMADTSCPLHLFSKLLQQ
jgi:4-phytase/acid phosphatase